MMMMMMMNSFEDFFSLQNLVEGKMFHEAAGRCLVAFQKAVADCISLMIPKNFLFLTFNKYYDLGEGRRGVGEGVS